jgi:hypothetical protein
MARGLPQRRYRITRRAPADVRVGRITVGEEGTALKGSPDNAHEPVNLGATSG